jgi:cobalt-zinc-cadmium resistance protein CzcA
MEKVLGIFLQTNKPIRPIGFWKPENKAAVIFDTVGLREHPAIISKMLEWKAAQANTQMEKAQNNVEWQVGFNNMSVTGWHATGSQANEKFYDLGNRFWSGFVGLNIPIFTKGLKARVESAGVQEKIAEKMVATEWQQLNIQYTQAITEWQGLSERLRQYQREIKPKVDLLLETAQRRYASGGIDYLEWNLALQQAIQAGLQEIELQKLIEDKVIDLQYFNANK